MNRLPDKLTTLRKHYNYSQKHIAKVLGVDVVTYMGYENGRAILNYEEMLKLSKFYHLDISELFINEKKITLYNFERQDTDKLNIEYFIPKNNLWFKIKRFVRNNKLISGLILGCLGGFVIVLLLFAIFKKPVVNEIIDINTLSVSNKTVLYLNHNGTVRGSGDNSKSQISNLPSQDVVKVIASDSFDLFLLNDGSLLASGDVPLFIDEACKKYNNVIDVSLGKDHLLILDDGKNLHCLGDNSFKQCDLNGESKIERIFAGENASVALTLKGDVIYSGDFIGKSSISDVHDIVDMDFSDTSLIYVNSEGKVDYNTNLSNKHFIESLGWSDIVDVACGHDFLVGLRSDGTVCVASDNKLINDEASSLKGIIAIDAAKDYFIAYDGSAIYGFGKNDYNQFISSVNFSDKLGAILNVHFESLENQIKLSFDPVYNASSYEVVFNGETFKFDSSSDILLDASGIEDGSVCTFTIKAIGDAYFADSDEFKFEYIYHFENSEEKPEEKKEETITIRNDLYDLSKDELEEYLRQIGVINIEPYEGGECSGDRIDVSNVQGITAGATYKISDLKQLVIKYSYCKLKVEEEENEEDVEG